MAVKPFDSEARHGVVSPGKDRIGHVNAYLERYAKRAREPFVIAIGDTICLRELTIQEEAWLQGRLHTIREATRDPSNLRNDAILRGFLQEEIAYDALNLIAASTGLPLRVRPSIFMEVDSDVNKGADFVIVMDNKKGVGKIVGGIDIKSKRPFTLDAETRAKNARKHPHSNNILGEDYPVIILRLGGIEVIDDKGNTREMRDHVRDVAIPRFLEGTLEGDLPGIAHKSKAALLSAIRERFSMECASEQQALTEALPDGDPNYIQWLADGIRHMDALLGEGRHRRRKISA